MKRSLKNAASILATGRSRAFVSRVAWLELERLISSTFNELSECKKETSQLGNLYLYKNRDREPFNKPNLYAFNIMNQILIHTGWRSLNVAFAITENGETQVEYLHENGANLWFSQDVSGAVMVFVSPYKSKALEIHESNIILARYSCASSVTPRDIRRHFSTYFRYCSVTSAHGNLGITGYIYRLFLKYGDFRYSTQRRASLFRVIESVLAVVGIAATLYAGNKIFT